MGWVQPVQRIGVPCAIPFEGAEGAKLYLQGATSQRVEFFIFLFVLL